MTRFHVLSFFLFFCRFQSLCKPHESKKKTKRQKKNTSKGSVHVMLLILPFTLIQPFRCSIKLFFLALALQHVIPYRTGEQLIETCIGKKLRFTCGEITWAAPFWWTLPIVFVVHFDVEIYSGCALVNACSIIWSFFFNSYRLLSFLFHLFKSLYFSVQVSSWLVPVRYAMRWEWLHNQEFMRNSSFKWKLYDWSLVSSNCIFFSFIYPPPFGIHYSMNKN